jgi:hypothetical protein
MKWFYKDTLGGYREFLKVEDFPENAYGFIYRVTNIVTNRFYIGRKVLYNNNNKVLTKKEISEWSKPGRVPKKKKVTTESDWLDYFGSNKQIKAEVKELGPQIFTREVLQICFSKKQLSYWEVCWQMKLDVLHIDSYNDNIQGRFFRKDLE